LPETVAQGSTGFLVPPGDVPALTQALDRLLADPVLCRTMGQAGQRRNVARFNWDAVGQRIEAVANRVANPELV
jgi:glycosyltransferase involved in cell wall biosynthesis